MMQLTDLGNHLRGVRMFKGGTERQPPLSRDYQHDFRGAMDGDSNRVRKAHILTRKLWSRHRAWSSGGPIISFGPTYLKSIATPHDDALVVQATIVDYDVALVFIDSGSSVNILFKEALDGMQVDPVVLCPMSISLFSFARHEVKLLRKVNLPLSLEEESL